MTGTGAGAISLWGAIARTAATEPSRTALTLGGEVRTYGELRDRSAALAARLATDLGVSAGDRVALLARNRLDYLEIEIAVSRAGAVLVALSWRYATEELTSVLARSGAVVLVADPDLAGIARRARAAGRLPRLRSIVVLDEESADLRYGDLTAVPAPVVAEVPVQGSDPHEIIYTSGTTGSPKGAVWTTGGVVWNAMQQIADFGIDRDSSTFVCFDLNYIGGRHQYVWGILLAGGVVHLKPSSGFDPGLVAAEVERRRVTHLLLVPTMLADVLDVLERRVDPWPELRMMMCGGAPVTDALLARASTALPHAWLSHVYGLTEGGGTVTHVPLWAADRTGTAGVPSLNVRLRIVGPDGPVPAGVVAEVQVAAPTVCAGYWEDDEATARLFDGPWLRTGDLGRLDEDGFLQLTGRSKELIISGGMNIFPAEVEAVIEQHPAVRAVAVVGAPHARWGETVAAVVELHDETQVGADELVALCREHLAGHKKPTVVRFVDGLPRTASGKIRKQELRTLFVAVEANDV